MPVGPSPTGIVVTAPDEASIRETESSASLVTHTARSPTATPRGLPPTPVASTTPTVRGLILTTLFSPAFATQTPSNPVSTADGSVPATPVGWTT